MTYVSNAGKFHLSRPNRKFLCISYITVYSRNCSWLKNYEHGQPRLSTRIKKISEYNNIIYKYIKTIQYRHGWICNFIKKPYTYTHTHTQIINKHMYNV